jgi:hypothetical protein
MGANRIKIIKIRKLFWNLEFDIMTALGIPVVPEVKILSRTSLELTATGFGTLSGVISSAFVKFKALLIKTVSLSLEE